MNMIFDIENDYLKVSVSERGAELQSIICKKNGKEYLWQGLEQYWTGRAYNMFPICCRLTEERYTYKGNTYEMNIHGFVRGVQLKGERISDTELIFTLYPSEAVKSQYPFDFVYTVRYTLDGNTLKTEYGVTNTGKDVMYFAVGGHPGFNVPLCEDETFDDYYLEFDDEKPIKRYIYTPHYYTGKTEAYPLKNGKIIELYHGMFDNDGIFFFDMSEGVTLKSKKSNVYVRLDYKGFRNLGIWHKPKTDAPYICIEPCTSIPAYEGKIDDLETKEQMEKLKAGERYDASFSITIG